MRHAIKLACAPLFWYTAGEIAGLLRQRRSGPRGLPGEDESRPAGISVVIPSRNGKHLLDAQLPGLARELEGFAAEIIVTDNGSEDGTAGWLGRTWPQARADISIEPLSFARAVNRGIALARYSHVCLLNNDMLLDPGFFSALVRAFEQVPELFCATAQIRFPAGVRREETGKAVMAQSGPGDFPIRCDVPLPGEDQSYVLYGSGGCSLYDSRKLRALGGADEAYAPAYVEDLDLGYRAWLRGWPSVYVAGAVVEHRHRATTSRYYTEEQLAAILEINYLKFLARAISAPPVFRRLWRQALRRLRIRRALAPLRAAPGIAMREARRPTTSGDSMPEEWILALASGAVAVFPGRPATGRPRVLIAAPDLPEPPYDAMRRAAADCDQVLVAFADRLETPPAQIREICVEVIVVQSAGASPSPAFQAALRQTLKKWSPATVQLDSTLTARYAPARASAR